MKNIKMIVVDMDRTLLRSDKTISDYTVHIFKKAKEKGYKIILATARPIRGVAKYLEQIKCDGVIYHNGAEIHCDGKRLYSHNIPYQTAKNIITRISEDYPDMLIAADAGDVLHSNFDASKVWNYAISYRKDLSELSNITVDKLIFGLEGVEQNKIVEKYLPDDLYLVSAESKIGEIGMIMRKSVSKINGLKMVAEHYNTDLKDVISFGDHYNDVGLVRDSGIGVAMLNSIEDVIVVSDYIAESNEMDGVAKFIENNILWDNDFEFIIPCNKYREQYFNIVNEFKENDENIIPYGLHYGIEKFDKLIITNAKYDMGIDLPEGFVSSSTYWYVRKSDSKIVGAISIRHTLNENLKSYGGHIGYGVVPSERRKGYATKMLSIALKKCVERGIQKVLIICDMNNSGSAKTIINNGGKLDSQDVYDGKPIQRYWIEL